MADLRLLASGHELVVRARDERGARVVSIGGEADLQTEHRLSRALRAAIPRTGTPLILDLTGLTFCSAYAMGVLVDMVSSTAHRGVTVAVVGLPPVSARVWLLTNVPVPTQYASVELAVAALTAMPTRATDRGGAGPGTSALLAEVDELRRALASRVAIEQAKGMLMERLGCSSEEAFNLIVLQSQQSARPPNDVAADYVRSGSDVAADDVAPPMTAIASHGERSAESPDLHPAVGDHSLA